MTYAVNLHGQAPFFSRWIFMAYTVNLHGQVPIFFLDMDFCGLCCKFTRTSSYFFSRYGFLWPLL